MSKPLAITLYCVLHQTPRLMTLLQVVTYDDTRVCPVLRRVLCPQTLMSVQVRKQELFMNWGLICTCSRGPRMDTKPGTGATGHPGMATLSASPALIICRTQMVSQPLKHFLPGLSQSPCLGRCYYSPFLSPRTMKAGSQWAARPCEVCTL